LTHASRTRIFNSSGVRVSNALKVINKFT